jgi:acetolactate synthase-1/2/3 large subunit
MGDQAAPFAALGRPARTVSSAEEALQAVAEAMALTVSAPRGPAYIGIPSDILNSVWDGPLPRLGRPSTPSPEVAQVEALADLVAASPRIIIWSGGGVAQAGEAGEAAVRALAERLGAPVVTTYAGRGVMAGHPLAIETSTHEPEVEALIGGADLLLVIGSGFDAMHTKNWKMAVPARRAAISLGAEVGRTIEWDLLIQADLIAAIDALLPLLPAEPRQPWAPTDVRDGVLHRRALQRGRDAGGCKNGD